MTNGTKFPNDAKIAELIALALTDKSNFPTIQETLTNFQISTIDDIKSRIYTYYEDADPTFSYLTCLASNLMTDIDDYMNTDAPDDYSLPTWYTDELLDLVYPNSAPHHTTYQPK